jgi:hypothetical protein
MERQLPAGKKLPGSWRSGFIQDGPRLVAVTS